MHHVAVGIKNPTGSSHTTPQPSAKLDTLLVPTSGPGHEGRLAGKLLTNTTPASSPAPNVNSSSHSHLLRTAGRYVPCTNL